MNETKYVQQCRSFLKILLNQEMNPGINLIMHVLERKSRRLKKGAVTLRLLQARCFLVLCEEITPVSSSTLRTDSMREGS